MEVCGEAEDVDEALAEVKAKGPDLNGTSGCETRSYDDGASSRGRTMLRALRADTAELRAGV
jgi:hypothetical protein